MKKLMLFIALMIAFSAIASAACSPECTGGNVCGPNDRCISAFENIWGSQGENWGAVAAIAVLLSILFTALAYMMGLAFSQRRLTVWAKNELYQALASAFMFAFILGFVAFLAGFSADLSNMYAHHIAAGCTSDADCGTGAQNYCNFDSECTPPRTCHKTWLLGGQCTNGYSCVKESGQSTGQCTISCETLIGPYKAGDTGYHLTCASKILTLSKSSLITQADQLFNVNIRIQFLARFSKYFDISSETFYSPTVGRFGPLGLWPPAWPHPYPADLAMGVRFTPYAGVSMLGDAMGYFFPILFAWIASFIAQEFFLRMIRDSLFPLLLSLGLILRTFFFTRKLGGLLIAIAIGLYTFYPLMYIMFADRFLVSETDLWYDKWNPVTCFCDASNPWWGLPFQQSINCPVRFCTVDFFTMILIGVAAPHLGLFDLSWVFTIAEKLGGLMVPALLIPGIMLIVTVSFIKGLSPLLGGDVEIAGLTHLI